MSICYKWKSFSSFVWQVPQYKKIILFMSFQTVCIWSVHEMDGSDWEKLMRMILVLVKLWHDFMWIDCRMGVFGPPVRMARNCLMIDYRVSDLLKLITCQVHFWLLYKFSVLQNTCSSWGVLIFQMKMRFVWENNSPSQFLICLIFSMFLCQN